VAAAGGAAAAGGEGGRAAGLTLERPCFDPDGQDEGRVSTHVATDGAQVSLRRMRADDALILFEWQCHPDTRRFARNPQPPELEGHKK
jgi:hypothetical protein